MRLPQPGQAVGPYICVRLLASGGMGAVYEARHPDLPRAVALKLLLAPDDPDLVARFRREAEACARLSHPNLVRVHGSGTAGQACYLVMELVKGESLQAQLDRAGPLEPEVAKRRIQEAAAGIAHAHAAGVLHRDLKPSNLLWDEELSCVRVVDFGLTGRLSTADSLTATGEVLGTPGYLSPEQIGAGGGATGPATDVYGLGATLFALLSGRAPFVGGGMAGLAQVAMDSAPDVRSLRAEVDSDLAALIASCLQKDAALRPASPEAFLAVLEGQAQATSVSPRRQRRRVALALGAALLIALLAGGAYLYARGSGLRKAEAYAAWKTEAQSDFAYGWGEASPELAGELAAWAAALDADSAPTQEAWQAARRDVRAQRRILAALDGEELGVSRKDLKLGPEDHLAQAVIELRAERSQEAAAALDRVEGPLKQSPAARQTRHALEARLEPRRFLGALRARSPAERDGLRGQFPAALAALAPDASCEDLLSWRGVAGQEAWAPALRGAISGSTARRKRELQELPPSERPRYLKRLCGPLRAAGLWPDSSFRAVCREVFREDLAAVLALDHGSARRQRARELVHIEHEMFYRVEATPFLDSGYRNLLNEPSREDLDPVLERTLHRYSSNPSGFGLSTQGPRAGWRNQDEPGSALEGAYAWWRAHANGGASSERALEDLERLLTSKVLDIPPTLSHKLFESVESEYFSGGPGSIRGSRDAADRLSALAKAEFERTLPWVEALPRESLSACLGAFTLGRVWPYLILEPRQLDLALENFDALAGRLVQLERDALAGEPGVDGFSVRQVLAESVIVVHARLADHARRRRIAPQVLSRLLPLAERMKARPDTSWEFSAYWAGVISGLRETDRDRALATIDRVRLDERAHVPSLSLEVAAALEGTPAAKRALPGLNRALAYVDKFEGVLTGSKEIRAEIQKLVRSCSR